MFHLDTETRCLKSKTKQKTKVQALTDINYEFKEKGFYAILGKSGSGKTTLLNIIAGLDKPTSGEVIFEGQAFSSFKGKDFDAYRNTCVGFVFQEFNLLENLNVYKNVSLALRATRKKSNRSRNYRGIKEGRNRGFNLPKYL